MATNDEVLCILEMLQAAYPNYKPQNAEAMVQVYQRMLTRYDVRQLNAAMDKVIVECKWFPTLAEIVKEVQQTSIPNRSMDDLRAERTQLEDGDLCGEDRAGWKRVSLGFFGMGYKSTALANWQRFKSRRSQ